MKKLLIILILFSGIYTLFSEEIKIKTGDFFGSSLYDYFTPVAGGVKGSFTCVSRIKNMKKTYGVLLLSLIQKMANLLNILNTTLKMAM